MEDEFEQQVNSVLRMESPYQEFKESPETLKLKIKGKGWKKTETNFIYTILSKEIRCEECYISTDSKFVIARVLDLELSALANSSLLQKEMLMEI